MTEAEIAQALTTVPGWTRRGQEIERTFDRGSFTAALAFVNALGAKAEAANHHPDIDIRYAKVRLVLTTHDAGGLSPKDFALAREINALA